MAYQQKEGQGSLFKNDKQNDRQPDFRGSIMIKGVLYNVSAWNRVSQNGREYISLQADERNTDVQQNYGAGQNYYPPRSGQPYGGQPQQAYEPAPSFQSEPIQDIPAPGLEDMPVDDLPF